MNARPANANRTGIATLARLMPVGWAKIIE